MALTPLGIKKGIRPVKILTPATSKGFPWETLGPGLTWPNL